MPLAHQITMLVDRRHAHRPGPVGKHHHAGIQVGRRDHRVVGGSYRVHSAFEASRRARPDLRPGLTVERPVTFHEPGAKATQDHLRGLVETLSRFVHRAPEGLELAPGEAATDAEAETAPAEMV